MKAIKFSPFSLTLRSFEFFPRRVMYLALDPSEQLLNLKARIEEEFPEYGKENFRPFVPHITIKRWQRYEYDELKKRIEANPLLPKTFLVESLTLFKAEKDKNNRKYHPVMLK